MHTERLIILRDNKENGPFSLDELIHFPLYPKDLVWIEGKSNGWSYPNEISALKPYVRNTNNEMPPVDEGVNERIRPDSKTIEKKVKEIAKHIFVSMPNTNKVVFINQQISLADRLERKAQEIYKRVQAYNQQKTIQPIDAPKQSGVRTLSDLRKQYTDWKIAKRQEKRYKNMFKVIFLVAGVLLLVATYFTWIRTKNEAVFINDEVIRYSASPVSKSSFEVENVSANKPLISPIYEEVDIPEENTQTEKTSVDEFIDSVNKVLAKQGKIKLDLKKYSSKKAKNKGTSPPLKADTAITENKVQPLPSFTERAVEANTLPTEITLKSLVSISTKHQFKTDANTLKDLNVTVHNNSTAYTINILVDVFYYKSKERLIGKETLFFSAVSPQGSSTLAANISKKATSAKCKINTVTASNKK